MQKKPKGIKVLIVDDEPGILHFLELGLKSEGFEIRSAADGFSALDALHDFTPNVVILDIMMPGMNGFEVCKLLKEKGTMAVIMLTAKDEVYDRVKGFEAGADDYLIKPFSFEELLARIYARVRNQFPEILGKVSLGPFVIDDARKEISYCETVLDLSPTEYHLLKFFIQNHGIVLSKAVILDKVWGYGFHGDENIVEVYVRSLRTKLQDHNRELIRTLRSLGYMVDLSKAF